MDCKFQPEGGKEPYIFVSYCHRDGELVAAILNRLYDLGLRIWYDDGINLGSDWAEVVERKLQQSQAVLAFYSQEFMESEPCCQEVHTALNYKRKLLPIYLEEDVKLAPGLGLRTALCNAVRYWEYRDKEKFYKKLLMDSAIRACIDPARGMQSTQLPQLGQLSPLWAGDKKEKIAIAAQQERSRKKAEAHARSFYHCVECGGKINDDTVLFDLGGLFRDGLETLPFRLTEAELRLLQRDGEFIEGRAFQCAMSLGEILSFMGNGHNLDNPVTAMLTRDQLRMFADGESREPVPALSPRESSGEEKESEALRRDAERLLDTLDSKGNVSFTLELIGEQSADGVEVITAVMADGTGNGKQLLEQRLCPHCKQPLYRRAGTAEHKVVTFLGMPQSGKTGILQAMLHYAHYQASFDRGHPIWQGVPCISQLGTVELLHVSPALRGRERFEAGLAPDAGTETGEYTGATFRIRERTASQEVPPRETILTLVELPGSVCDSNGVLDRTRIINRCPIVLDSAALVVCQNVYQSCLGEEGNEHAVEYARKTGALADQFQSMLVNVGARGSIPMLLLFTACPDLEGQKRGRKTNLIFSNPVQQTYQLNQERGNMEKNPYYKKMIQLLANAGTIQSGFRAELRCSAFGFLPGQGQLLTDGSTRQPETKQVRPVNVDRLLRWILSVTGCIPVHSGLKVRGYMDRRQFRMENPEFDSNLVPVEAVLRCTLFSNPGVHDTYLVENLGNKLAVAGRKMTMKPDSNHRN